MEKKPVVRYFYKGEWLEATVSDIGDMTTLLTQSKNSIVAAINELYATGGSGTGEIPQNVQEKLDEINGAVEGINDFINSGGLNDTMAQQVQDKLNGVNTVINEYIRQVQDELSKDLSDARKEYADKVQTVENALEGAKQSIADSASALEKLKNDLIEIDLNVTTVSQEVDTIKGELSTKVETSDFDLAQAQIRQNTTNISQNANEIAMKVSEDTFNAATERITQAEAALVVQANLIESKVTSEEVREEIDKIDKYRPNLFKRTRDWEGFVPRDKTKFSVTSNTYKQCHIANFTTNGTGCYQIVEDLVIGETYTISVFVSSTSSTAVVGAKVGTKVIPMAPIDGAPISTTMNRYSGSFVAGTDSTIEILFRASSGSMAAPKLEKGKDASPWQPHVDDDYAKIVVNETSIKQTDDRITQTVKTIEQQGEDIEINSTAINQLGDSIGLQANKITDIEGKVVDNTANLNIAFNQISTKVSQTDVDSSIADISLDGSNKILNSDFGDDFENWYEVSPQFSIVDFDGMKCASVERSGLTADLTLSLATNKFALSNGERLMFGFGFGTKDKTKIDKPLIARLEIFDINDVRVDTVDINLNQVTGLVNGKISRFNGVYLCERADAAKARLKFQLARNGSVYFTRPMAQLGSIASTDWSLNPEDLVQRKIKYESAIEQTADRITSTVKEYTDGEVSKAVAQAEADFKTANDNALKAQTDATNANTNLNNLSKDTILTPIEKRNLAKEWETIKSDYTLVKAQCEKYGISASTLTTRYNTLNTYVPPLLTSITTSSTIVPATFRANFKNYYDEKVKALNLIADRVKTLGDTAASDALASAKSYADSQIEQTATSITSTVKTYTDGEVKKAKDQATADFTSATNAAKAAQDAADSANTSLTNLSKDTVLSPIEKKDLAKEWEAIKSDYVLVKAQCVKYAVADTTLTSRYNTLNTYVPPLLSSMTTNSTIVPATFRANFKNYYDEKVKALNLVADKVRSLSQSEFETANENALAAQTSANAANTAITNFSKDTILTPLEKKDLAKEWESIKSDYVLVKAQCDKYGVPVSTLTTRYNTLNTYVPPLLTSMSANSTIVPATFRANFKNYYDEKVKALNLVADMVRTLSIEDFETANNNAIKAQNAANTANNNLTNISKDTVLSAIEKKDVLKEWEEIKSDYLLVKAQCEKYSVAATTLTSNYNKLDTYITPLLSSMTSNSTIVPATFRSNFKNYYDEKVRVLNLVADMVRALSIEDFETANNNALKAQTAANTANTNLTNISKDTILSPIEKKDLAKEWATIQSDYSLVKAQCDKYSVAATNLTTRYNTLNTYVPPLLTSMTTNTTIVPATFRANFKNYYDEKVKALNLIADKVKALGDSAASNALTSAKTYADSKIEQTATSITSTVKEYTDGEVGKVNRKVDGLEIGGRNWMPASEAEWVTDMMYSNSAYGIYRTGLNGVYEHLVDNKVMVSFEVFIENTVDENATVRVYGLNGTPKYELLALNLTGIKTNQWVRVSGNIKIQKHATNTSESRIEFYGGGNTNTSKIRIRKLKLEKGTKATDWTPAPEDVLKDAGSYTDSEVDKAKEQAKADFNTANNAAKAAQSAADKANTNLTDISKDTILSPIEKKDLAKEWDSIKSDYTLVKAQAEKYSVATTNLVAKYTTLNSYVPPLLASMTTNSTIVPATLRANFKNYYDEKVKVLNLVADKVKELGDKAASDALNAAKTYAESKIEQTADSITSEVTNYTDSEIEGLREYTDSKIEQTASSITTEVKEYTTEEVGKLNYYEAYSNSPNGEQDFTLVLPKRNFCDGSEFTDGKWKFESTQDETLHTAYAWSADGTDRFTTVYPGENLIRNSTFENGMTDWTGASYWTTNTATKLNEHSSVRGSFASASDSTKALRQTLTLGDLAVGDDIVWSVWAKSDTPNSKIHLEIWGSAYSTDVTIGTEWTRVSLSGKLGAVFAVFVWNITPGTFWVSETKLERGATPTIYTPAPSEHYANAYPLYEGTYTDYSDTASTNPADYTWKAVSKQNIPVYSHTAYSWSEDGQNRFTDRYPKENLLSMENLGVWPLNTELAVIEGTQKVTLNSTSTENLGVHCQNETTIKIGEKYTLSYELKVLSGTVIQIGGHIYGYNQEGKVKVNGTEVDGTYATGFPYSLAAGSTNKIELKLVGSGVSGTVSDGVYIQPNRGAYTTSFNAEVTNIKLEKGHDGATIYTPSPIDDEINAYPTHIGKYTDTVVANSTTPSKYTWKEIGEDQYIHRSFSWSMDGTKNFTPEFPNENLLPDSDAISLAAENAEFGRYFSDANLPELTCSFVKVDNAPCPSKYVVQGVSIGGDSNPMAARSIAWHDGGGQVTLELGETYTMSCMARLVSGSGRLRFQYGINPYYNNFQEIHSSEWRQYSWTFTAEQPSTRIYMPAGSAHLPGVIQTCCFKLEKGAVATSYTPALSEGLRDTYPSFIGTYLDEEEDDSNSSEDYNWTFLLNNDGKYDLSNKDRTPIVNEEISYCLGGDNFIPPKNGWSVEIPVMARDYLLYSKTVWTFKDGLSETAFRVHEMGRHGSNGLPKTYDSEAKMVYEHSAYSWSIDGTERFAYMYPRENLIKNSSFKQSITNIWDSVGTSPIELETVDEYDALKIELTSSNPSGVNTGDDLKSLVTDGKLSIGDIVSYQMLMKADVDSTDVFVGLQGSGINKATPVNLGVDWKLVTIENEVFQDDNTSMRVYSTNSTNKGTNVYIANVKLERGRSCTVYTPKPSENPSAAYPMYIGTYESNDIENSRKPELYSWRQIEPGMIADSGTTTINKQGSLSLSSQEVEQPSMSLDGISDDSDYVLSIYAKATVESDVRLRLIEYVYTDKAPTSTVWIDSLQTVGTEWGRIHASCLMPKNTVEKDNYWVVSIETFQPSGTVDIKQVKLETGTEPTTFLKAPEENETESRMQYKGISLVGGEEFESYTWFPMTANDIDLHEVLKKVNEASANMTRFEQDFDSFEFKVVNPFISSTNEMLGNIESYMRFSDSGLKLGRSDSPFFVNLSGTELGFYNSPNYDPRKTDISEVEDDKIAWINGSELHIKMAIIENTIQLGRHTIDKLESKPDITVVRFAG